MPLLLLQGMRAGAAAQRDRPPIGSLIRPRESHGHLKYELVPRPHDVRCAELPDDDSPARPSCAVSSHPSA